MSDSTTSTQAATTATEPATTPGIAWLPGVTDTDTIGTVQAKGWQGPADPIKGYRELEKLLGADRAGRTFTLPKDDNDKDGWAQVWQKLGRPETPEAYGFDSLAGTDKAYAQKWATKLHELGVPAKQAKALAEFNNSLLAESVQQAEQAEQQALEAEHKALEAEWGAGPAAAMQKEIARRAAVKLGLDEASIGALEKVAGFSKVMKAFAKMGELMGEHKAEGLESMGSFGLTPAAAQARLNALQSDREWGRKLMSGDAGAKAEWDRLVGIVAQNAERVARGG